VIFGAVGTYTEEEMRELMAGMDRKIKPIVPLRYEDLKKEQRKKEAKRG